MSVEINIENVSVVITKQTKFLVEIKEGEKVVSFLDSWENPVYSSHFRARVKNEIMKYFPRFLDKNLDKMLIAGIISKRTELTAMGTAQRPYITYSSKRGS